MKKLQNIKPHLAIISLFLAISFIYFFPVIEGKQIETHDVKTWQGMSKEIVDFREKEGEEPLWTNSMFSGMPAYQISTKYHGNLIQYIDKLVMLPLPRPVDILFLYLLGFYLLLLSLNIDKRLSAIGAIAFAFSSYFFIIIQAGHMSKAHAIAYLPMVVAGVLYTYRGSNMFLGAILTAVAVSLEIYCNHLQITYYLFLLLLLLALVQFVKDLRSNNLLSFFKRSALLLCAALLACGTDYTRLATTMEYGKDTIRGKSELTNDVDNKTTGLDRDYATQWSYGIAETMTLLIPNFYGGSSQGELGLDSETYKQIRRAPNAKKIMKSLPLYWGDQPIVNGPTYAGAIVVFLFVLGLLFVKSEIRIWLLLATIMSIMLAWGKNFMFLTDLFLDYFPGYNKFRAVSTILIIAEFTFPLLAFLALNKFLLSDNQEKLDIKNKEKLLKTAFYVTGGIALLFALVPSLCLSLLGVESPFVGLQDSVLQKNGWPIEALQSDRATLLSVDAWRSFFFIACAFVLLWMFIKSKIKVKYLMLILGSLIIVDMWTVNKRYLNDSHFSRASKVERPYQKTVADQQILSDSDPNFRVFNQSVSTFNDASTSYFHKSIGGYHGAKLKRYQELIEFHIAKGNMKVLNMLNTKYFITPQGNAQKNIGALGNAWFINRIDTVQNADAEIAALTNFNPRDVAVVDIRFKDHLLYDLDNNNAIISLIEYQPNYLKYQSNSEVDGVAVFSEIYYDKGWNAYIDGRLTPHFRTNYILRGMKIPSGKHSIEFKFEPKTYNIGEKISTASSAILLVLLLFISVKELRS